MFLIVKLDGGLLLVFFGFYLCCGGLWKNYVDVLIFRVFFSKGK